MASKAFSGLIIAFWAVMMAALVRVEFFPAATRLTAVPIRLVVQRLFANHETQNLDVWYQGKDIGQCRITVTPRAKLDAKESEPVTGRPGAYFVDANLGMHLDILGTPTPLQLDTRSW